MKSRTKHSLIFIVTLIIIIVSVFCYTTLSLDKEMLSLDKDSNFPSFNNSAVETGEVSTDSTNINLKTYVQEDNMGYYSNSGEIFENYNHPLRQNYINLSVATEAEFAVAKIDQGRVIAADGNNVDGYGITGRNAVVKLKYNIPKTSDIYGQSVGNGSSKWNISNDSSQNIGDYKNIGVIGTGALIVQKSYDGKTWEWQDKDGTSHSQLHTFNFPDTVPPADYNKENAYTLYTPSGEDLGRGVYIKFKYCYEVANTDTWTEKALGFMWGVQKSKTYYKNIIEEATIYMVQNSGTILFHNASNFDKIGEDDGTGAFTANDLETIRNGDATLNGFRIDTMGVDGYTITYKKNGVGENKANNGQIFFEQGRYDFTIARKIGAPLTYTIFVDRREPNKAATMYFGRNGFITEDSQRIYTTGEYPAYIAGKVKWNVNATNGTVLPVVGKLFKVEGTGEVTKETLVRNIIQPMSGDYKTNQLQGEIKEAGIYKAEFWGNPHYLNAQGEIAEGEVTGDLYHFTYRFEVVSSDTPAEPSINETYLRGLTSFSDLQSKYYAVSMPTKGSGKAIFAFASYSGAYNYSYKYERSKVVSENNLYLYDGTRYTNQTALITAIDKKVQKLVEIRYFDSTNQESYQTADISDESVTSLNFNKDIIVFANDQEQDYAKTDDIPSINGRKYRYISPDTGEISEGVLEFKFLNIANFESSSVSLINKETKLAYDLEFDVSVEYQLGLANAPSGIYTVKETNKYGNFAEYDVRYIAKGDFLGEITTNIFRNGKYTQNIFNIHNRGTTVYAHGFRLTTASNALDTQSIVKVEYKGAVRYLTFEEIDDVWFSEGGAYDFTLIDRQGNSISFAIVIDKSVGIATIQLNVESSATLENSTLLAFVGEEIALPTINIEDDRFVFEGWYNITDDDIITNGKIIPTKSGKISLWEQLKQQYTYLNFDGAGGITIDSIKATVGQPIQLPITSKDGWSFGGWDCGGIVYPDTFTPTAATSNFTAIWNYISTNITLNNGDMVNTITARPGETVKLLFPTRSGYTFLGWYETISETKGKVYFGQITQLANISNLSLDALWIRNSEIDFNSLNNGTGGKVRVHFVNGDLDSTIAQGYVGSTIDAPIPTRGGYKFVGWMWRTSETNGKIFTNKQIIIPDGAEGKIIVEALWIARSTNPQALGAGTLSDGAKWAGMLHGNNLLSVGVEAIATSSLALMVIVIIALSFRKKKFSIKPNKRVLKQPNIEAFQSNMAMASAGDMGTAPISTGYTYSIDGTNKQPTLGKRVGRGVNSYKAKLPSNIGLFTVCLAVILAIVLFFVSTLGDFTQSGRLQGWIAEQKVIAVQQEQKDKATAKGVNSNINTSATQSKGEIVDNFTEIMYAKSNKYPEQSNEGGVPLGKTIGVELTDDEAFLYALIMLDFYSLGYDVFPAKAVLADKSEVYGLGYSAYAEGYNKENSDITYFSAGIVAFPNQKSITKEDIDAGIEILDASITEEEAKTIDAVYSYILSFTESYGAVQFVADGKYVVYSVNGTDVEYTAKDNDTSLYNADYGTVYNYDEGRIVFDPDMGDKFIDTATSLNTLLDGQIAKQEYTQYITEQTRNGFTVDTMNFVFLNYSALEAYYLSQQDESLLGIDIQEFYDMEKTLGANEYYSVDADGNLAKMDFPPSEENKASWLDRLAGAILAIGTICIGVIIVAVLSTVTCAITTALSPSIMGAFIGGGMEIFMQTVVQGNKISDINWLRVGIAAVSGAISAIPGLGWLGAGLVQGVTELALTLADGGSLEDALKAFTIGVATGFLIHGVGKALGKMKFCFVAGTPVLMAGGYLKSIENIRAGDIVKSYDESTGKIEDKRVLSTSVNNTSEVVKVNTSNGDEIVATPGHPFYANGRWVDAIDLRAGDILVSVNGNKVIVEQVSHEILESPVKVYNFEVADNHTYLVGDNGGVVVHNSACSKSKPKLSSNELGKQGEEIAGKYLNATKNTKSFDVTNNALNKKNRIPDFVTKNKIVEVKNVKNQSFTTQIKDSIAIAGSEKKKFQLIADTGTHLSKPLKTAIKDAGGSIKRLIMR